MQHVWDHAVIQVQRVSLVNVVHQVYQDHEAYLVYVVYLVIQVSTVFLVQLVYKDLRETEVAQRLVFGVNAVYQVSVVNLDVLD